MFKVTKNVRGHWQMCTGDVAEVAENHWLLQEALLHGKGCIKAGPT